MNSREDNLKLSLLFLTHHYLEDVIFAGINWIVFVLFISHSVSLVLFINFIMKLC